MWSCRTRTWAHTPDITSTGMRMEERGKRALDWFEAASDGPGAATASSDNASVHSMYQCMVLTEEHRHSEDLFKNAATHIMLCRGG